MMATGEEAAVLETQETLLYSARHGEINIVRDLLKAFKEGKLTLDISCKGKNKSNLGWTPLHLATYFGHLNVAEILLESGADVDAVNDQGDTPLHKAALIGKEDLIVLLLKHGADVLIVNGEGFRAVDVAVAGEPRRLLSGAELAQRRAAENALLAAAKEGHLDDLNALLRSRHPPNINCVDAVGNSALHLAAYRHHAHVAIALLQNGIDTTITNNNGQLAVELAREEGMVGVLSVRAARRPPRPLPPRTAGPLLRRTPFFNYKPTWAVLERGVVTWYGSGAAAARGVDGERRHLDGGAVSAHRDAAAFTVRYSDGASRRYAVPATHHNAAAVHTRQEWIEAFKEHIAYSSHYLWTGGGPGQEQPPDDDAQPIGTVEVALGEAGQVVAQLARQVGECAAIVDALPRDTATPLHHSAYMRFLHAVESGERAVSVLTACAEAVRAERDAHSREREKERERRRVLEQALQQLARTHHRLEHTLHRHLASISESKSKRKDGTRTDVQNNLFGEGHDSDSDTLVSGGDDSPLGALSPWEQSPTHTPLAADPPELEIRTDLSWRDIRGTLGSAAACGSGSATSLSLHTALSPASSLGTLVSHGGHVYRNASSTLGLYKPSSAWSL